uniref:ATP synthase F0 subunit 8 n=1 Tax=Gonepteryx amintha TaxID=441324 RepID=UPI002551FCD9|nr:ATP synthase F0 subunit 8 [Gonepteryx amintha]WGL40165.1 ATP synthase F0 subunit 8 [Gonepteryx amintha]WHS18931.1 ATP synthase F0 subunit 8 [Gonepteryx amintha]
MPQMMPINWLFYFFFFLSIFIMFNIMNYYIYYNINFNNKLNLSSFKKKNFYWKW